MRHEARSVGAAARRAGGKVHLVGHSFGRTVALAAALGGAVDVASVSVFEADPLAFASGAASQGTPSDAYVRSRQFAAAVDDGDPKLRV
jgi:pimeloyl-ACP methyl ester carboxylesterase